MFVKVLIVSSLMYLGGETLVYYAALADAAQCKGWSCEEVWCPDGYAIQVNGNYVPCEQLDKFIKEMDHE